MFCSRDFCARRLITPSIFFSTDVPIPAHDAHQKAPCKDGSDDPFEETGAIWSLPELRSRDTPNTVPDEIIGIDHGSLGVAFVVGGTKAQ